MLEIRLGEADEIIMTGRFDASQEQKVQSFLDGLKQPRILDCRDLEYISSAGLGVLLSTQKRLMPMGTGLKLVNVNKHIRDVFRYSGLDRIFVIG